MSTVSAAGPFHSRNTTLDVFRGLAVVSMLVNHTNWAFLPGVVRMPTSFLTVTMFAWCIGAGLALSWRRSAEAAGPRARWGSLYARHVGRSLLRAAVLLAAHMLLLQVGNRVSVVLGYLAVGLVIAALLTPLGLKGRAAAAVVLMAAEPFVHRAWEARAVGMGTEAWTGYFGTGEPHVWMQAGEWGNFLFGAASMTRNGDQYSGLGVAVMALVGMIAVDSLSSVRLPAVSWKHAAMGAGIAVLACAVARVGIALELPVRPYSKNPAERLLEIAMLGGLWWMTTALCRLWAGRSILHWLTVVGASTLSLYVFHAWMLTSLVSNPHFAMSAFYGTGLFGVAFTALWLAIPVLWHGVMSPLMAQWTKTPETAQRAGEARTARIARAWTRGPLEALEEVLTGWIPGRTAR